MRPERRGYFVSSGWHRGQRLHRLHCIWADVWMELLEYGVHVIERATDMSKTILVQRSLSSSCAAGGGHAAFAHFRETLVRFALHYTGFYRSGESTVKTIQGRVGAVVAVSFLIGIGGVSSAYAQSMFNHSIPIKIPKGANGMQPEIALVYDPGAGNGIVGMGWQLAGLSAITMVNSGSGLKCASSHAAPDSFAHTQLGNLVVQPDGSYRSQKETFTKLVPSGLCGNGACSWTAYDRAGTQFVYGATADSALTCSGTATVRTFALSKVVDLFGNSYEVTYWKDASNAQLYPNVITYTKGPGLSTYRTVEFAYESRDDYEAGYPQGDFQQMSSRLKWISVKSGGALLHQYRLDYSEYGYATLRSHLTAVQEYGSDGTSTLPAQTFGWQQGGLAFSHQSWPVSNYWGSSDYTWTGDFDGDGRTDIASANGG